MSKHLVQLLDSSILIELLDIPFEAAYHSQVVQEVDKRHARGVELRLPVAAVIESGDHVSKVADGAARRACASRLSMLLRASFDSTAPWKFSYLEWDRGMLDFLLRDNLSGSMLIEWFTAKHLEMGDIVILSELHRLRANLDPTFVQVDVWTTDVALAAEAGCAPYIPA